MSSLGGWEGGGTERALQTGMHHTHQMWGVRKVGH